MPGPVHHFVTYFDSHYAAKGVAMLESLLRRCPQARMTVLCFDDLTEKIVGHWFGGRVATLPRRDLEKAEPRLAPLRHERSLWEFYATHKAVVVRELLVRCGAGECLAYIDADTFFFSNPEPLFQEIASASIALSPHRFAAEAAHMLAGAGPYNAGFGIWRNDDSGNRCLQEWAGQCLDWCKREQTPDGRFMNQGYLRQWPARYERTLELTHPGANLAPWNLGTHALTRRGRKVFVDGRELIFFHFSSMGRDAGGIWRTNKRSSKLADPEVVDGIFRPYLLAVEAASDRLQKKYAIAGIDLTHRHKKEHLPIGLGTVRRYGPFRWFAEK